MKRIKPKKIFLPVEQQQMILQVAEPKSVQHEPITLVAAANLWLTQHFEGLKPNTKIRSEEIIKTFLKFVGDQTVDPELIGRYYTFLGTEGCRGTPAELSTIGLHKQRLTVFFNWLEQEGFIKESPMRRAPKPPKPRMVEPQVITLEEYQRLMKAALKGKPEYMGWMMTLAWNTGMSLCDCALLTWEVVDMEARELHPLRLKTESYGRPCRIVFEPGGELEAALILMKDHRNENWPNKPDKHYVHTECARQYLRYGKMAFGAGFRHLAKIAGVSSDKSFHSFRAAWCSRLMNSGMTFNQVALTTGHQQPQMLQRYVKPDMSRLGEQVAAAFAAERRANAKRLDPGKLEASV